MSHKTIDSQGPRGDIWPCKPLTKVLQIAAVFNFARHVPVESSNYHLSQG